MLEIIFGWRKAYKCKKLIRKVQCRLKLLKNKRCTIVRQLRDDVAQLLKHGHYHSAFNRVEQIYKDECIVVVYDLLDHFCEFIIIHLSYIRRHKDCPNDINEAVSSLIFASARCGDLPELRVIRKLFGERYGQRFAATALELLPGHLVNHKMMENLSINLVENDVKYRLVDEIARSCLKSGPLALECTSELHLQQKNKSRDYESSHDTNRKPQQRASSIAEAEGKIVHVDISAESKKFEESSMGKNKELMENYNIQLDCPLGLRKEGNNDIDSSSENLSNAPEEVIYLDDIEEFHSPTNKDGKGQDQRFFMFKPFAIPKGEEYEVGYDSESEFEEQYEPWNKKEGPKSSRKSRKVGEKRWRNRMVSLENGILKDESAIYYNHKRHHSRVDESKMQKEDSQKSHSRQEKLEHPCFVKVGNEFIPGKFVCYKGESEIVNHNCSLENPCYFCVSNKENNSESSPWHPNGRIALSKKEKSEHPIYSMISPGDHLSETQTKKLESSAASLCSCSMGTSSWGLNETQPPYLRAMTMPTERPKEDCCADNNMGRSNSFPYEQPSRFCNSSPHVHPKLPDYDELAAKFMALKKANLQNK